MSDSVGLVSKGLGGLFIAKGATKVIPFSAALQERYNAQFSDFATVFPLGLSPSGVAYKNAFGGAQILCGSLLVAGGPRAQKAGCVGLLGLIALALQSHVRVGDIGLKLVVPVLIGGALGWVYVNVGGQGSSTKASKKA